MPNIDLDTGKVWQAANTEPIKSPGRKLENWVLSYGKYTENNEAPESFHLWVALGTIAAAARRRIYMPSTFFDVLLNMYIVLVGPAGGPRKTTALKIGRGVIKDVPGIHFTTKASSAEALISQFAALPEKEHQSLTCYSYELGTMFKPPSEVMVDIVTDLYDGNPDWDKQTVGRGLEKIPRPWLNMMAATTPRWLGDNLPPTAVEGGFVSRTIFVYEDQRKLANAFPRETEAERALRKLLINDLTHISTLSGEFGFSQEAFDFYNEWYFDESRFPTIADPRTVGYYERKHIHVLKVAMCLSIAESDSLTLEIKDIRAALALLGSIEPGMKKAFSAVGRNTYAGDLERIYKQICAKRTGSNYGEIAKHNYHALDKKAIDDILMQLINMGAISISTSGVYKPVPGGSLDE